MSVPVEDTFELTGRVVGRYRVERAVARGGFGLVYKATHTELSTPVALKVLTPPEHLRLDSALIERFRLEARTLASLRHRAIVRVLDVGELEGHEGRVWMALEWLDGVTLDRDIEARQGRGRSPREVLSLLDPALDAVACAHDRGVAHRDLKPGNLMLIAVPNGATELHVLDFGIAKEMLPGESAGTGQTETASDSTSFSLAYAAPEQVGRRRTGPWTDVHALGLLVTELLTGVRAYGGDDSFALYAAIMASERPTPARHSLDVGPWEPVLRKAVALLPADRYASARALRDALAETVEDAERAWASRQEAVASRELSEVLAPVMRPRRRAALLVAAFAVSALALVGALSRSSPAARATPRALQPMVSQHVAPLDASMASPLPEARPQPAALVEVAPATAAITARARAAARGTRAAPPPSRATTAAQSSAVPPAATQAAAPQGDPEVVVE